MHRTWFGIAAGIIAGFVGFLGLAFLALTLANDDNLADLGD